ncbi:MAG: sigma-70 family RNA polymerase sigma factor [Gemmatimonadales bacterium]
MDLEAAFASHHPALFRYLYRLTGDADAAADIAQESFVRLLDNPVPEAKVRSWLFTVATNLVRDRARMRERRRKLLLQHGEPSRHSPERPDEELERDERIDSVRATLDRLSPRDRQLLMLREEGFRYTEIAKLVGVAPGSVGKLLARALERFARTYEPAGTDSAEDAEHEPRGGGHASHS